MRLAALAPRPLIVVVAHRAETLERCERILRFADGRLVGDEQVRESVAQEQHG